MKIIIDETNGRERRALALDLIKNIRRQDCPMQVTIEPYIEKHSDPQRGKFHVLIRELSRVSGYSEGECKDLIKREILGTKIIKIGGLEREVVSSSEYDDEGKPRDKPSYSDLIEATYRIASEAGIQLP